VPIHPTDILASDIAGRMVVLENQFGPTDHTHLGQIMTCVALRDRKFVESLLEAGFERRFPACPVWRWPTLPD
jgi:hypothetical protein